MAFRFQSALDGTQPDQIPFVPAIYEHKAWFVGKTPSVVCRDPVLLEQAILAEFEAVRPDAIAVGIDVYNVEAEAVGSEVTYFEGDDIGIPAIAADGTVLKQGQAINSLRLPDPQTSGRMPLFLEVAGRIQNSLGGYVPVRATLSGPFSLAANLMGAENLFLMTLTDPERVRSILDFAVAVASEYGKAFCRLGCGLMIFDSQSSPDLLSPAMYRDFVLGPTKKLIAFLRTCGAGHVPLIVGGNTTPILQSYCETGANNILCDSTADASTFLSECRRRQIAYRRNISSIDFLTDSETRVREEALREIEGSEGYAGFILGTGVVPYGTPTRIMSAISSVRTMKNSIEDKHHQHP